MEPQDILLKETSVDKTPTLVTPTLEVLAVTKDTVSKLNLAVLNAL
jgi:hypothetical protein